MIRAKRYASLRVKKQKFGETTCEVSGMDQREVLRKMAFTALGLVLAIEIVTIAGADAQPAEIAQRICDLLELT